MKLTTEAKKQIFKKFGGAETNTGTAEGQIALFTERISHMTEHMQVAKKDFSTQRALIRLVGKRRALLDYLHKNDINRYRKIIAELNIRK
ncbi:MAG: 30S ribosomal protein S15 [Bacteroidia bacterium]|jgi:small subunit ribosomal protein S15|nr:30S ribosomal protein S15 [Bacteroidia bacterium]MBP7437230.1 30S ribosomal protein S15 [Bacteroidia bacterium]MBP7728931.1 30S ribosomal protein S15 [Bacteroidia bacterium]MBP7772635.1 30S ribosomal protein S15 [Bacteroidia bacterium]HPD54624.1 30S ribosomal protein S15 [Bacteroidia bacterium]